ncbi:hypothetical protein [Streptomyces sp. NPDC018031]|uniref:hypothetical protein n=1 Tax=Streptomyces sp. NPDC018031 TaxID=3365033 RepID=UPI0037A4D8F2
MRIPGFTADVTVTTATDRGGTASAGPSPRAGTDPAAGRVVPQQFTCEEELGPVCRNKCRRSWNPRACFSTCIREFCAGDMMLQSRG